MTVIAALVLLVVSTPVLAGQAEIYYLGNEGFLVRNGEHAVIIDGLHEYYQPAYKHPSIATIERIRRGEPPFESLDFILVTHVHRDHFSPKLVVEVLADRPDVQFIGPPQAVRMLKEVSGSTVLKAEQLTYQAYSLGSLSVHSKGDIHIRASGMEHVAYMLTDEATGKRFNKHADVQNLGYVVSLADFVFVHVGDAQNEAENILIWQKPWLESTDVDLLFISPFTITGTQKRAIIEELFDPDSIILMHIDPRHEQIAIPGLENAYVLAEEMEMLCLETP